MLKRVMNKELLLIEDTQDLDLKTEDLIVEEAIQDLIETSTQIEVEEMTGEMIGEMTGGMIGGMIGGMREEMIEDQTSTEESQKIHQIKEGCQGETTISIGTVGIKEKMETIIREEMREGIRGEMIIRVEGVGRVEAISKTEEEVSEEEIEEETSEGVQVDLEAEEEGSMRIQWCLKDILTMMMLQKQQVKLI
jgi:hypothetical protein